MLSIYQMTHTGSPKQVIFGPDSVEITYISTGNIIVKGVANHASKEYDFSHFIPFLEPVHPQREGKKFPSPSLAISTSIAEPVVSVHEIQSHSYSDSYLVPTPSRKIGR